jgi:hypothetical protein
LVPSRSSRILGSKPVTATDGTVPFRAKWRPADV